MSQRNAQERKHWQRSNLLAMASKAAVRRQSRSINVDFGVEVKEDDKTDYKILSIDVVPALTCGEDYEIPDDDTGKWIKTNPKKHAEKATSAHQAYGNEWKGLVRMVKYWNNNPKHGEKPVKPSFMIEVMALQCLYGGWGGQFDRELQSFFATLADRIGEVWPDPAELGPPISNSMDPQRVASAQRALRQAAEEAGQAIHLVRQGKNGESLRAFETVEDLLKPENLFCSPEQVIKLVEKDLPLIKLLNETSKVIEVAQRKLRKAFMAS